MVQAVSESIRPLESPARWAVIGLVAVIVSDIVAIGSDLLEIRLMNRLLTGEEVSLETLDNNDLRQGIVALVVLAAFVVSAVLFIRWFHRAYSNLPALDVTTRFKRGWAIWAWFVPILWFWRPKQIANDIWRGGFPSPQPMAITRTEVPGLLGFWWAAWIIGGFAYTRSTLAYLNTPPADDAGLSALLGDTEGASDIRYAAILDVVASGIDIAAAVLAILVVRALTSRQVQRARVLATDPDAASAAGSTAAVE
jgi:hypothetical protein